MHKLMIGAVLATAGYIGTATGAELTGSEWGMKDKPERFVQFAADGRVSGSSGCNRFAGTYTLKGKRLSFGPLAGTRKLCPPEIMKAEKKFLAALGDTVRMKRTKKSLKMWNKSGRRVLKLRHRDWD